MITSEEREIKFCDQKYSHTVFYIIDWRNTHIYQPFKFLNIQHNYLKIASLPVIPSDRAK